MRISDWSSDVCSSDLHLGAAVDDAAQRLVDVDIVGNRRDRAADRVEQLALDPRFDVAPRARVVLGRIEPCPAAGEPVGLVRLVIGAELEFLFRSEEHTSELQSLMRISYAVFCLKKKKQ